MPYKHLDEQIKDGIIAAGIKTGLAGRHALIAGVDPGFLGLEPQGNTAAESWMLRVNYFNNTERLRDGSVPMEQLLSAAVLLLGSRPEADEFERALAVVRMRATVTATAPVATTLQETKERLITGESMVAVAFIMGAKRVADGVAKILVPRIEAGQATATSNGDPRRYHGTAWLIAPDLVVTNLHVIEARGENEPRPDPKDLETQASAAEIVFDFDGDGQQGTIERVAEIVAVNAELDYAILRLTRQVERLPLRLRRTPLTLPAHGEPALPMNIVQHPGGRSKRLAVRNNALTHVADREIRYFTDTEPGSSGAPVCDDAWQVAALHRSYVRVVGVTFQGREVAWVNVGTPILAILSDLQRRADDGDVHARMARNRIKAAGNA